jgi:hypothetical protein
VSLENDVKGFRKELESLQAALANLNAKLDEAVAKDLTEKEAAEKGSAPATGVLNPGTKESEEQKKARLEQEKEQKAAASKAKNG